VNDLSHLLPVFDALKSQVLSKYEHLIGQFAEARINLKLNFKPTDFGTSRARVEKDVENFLMDIRTEKTSQHILIYPGTETKIEVLDIDKDLHQLILSVQEPEKVLKVTRKVYRHKLQQYIYVTNSTISPA